MIFFKSLNWFITKSLFNTELWQLNLGFKYFDVKTLITQYLVDPKSISFMFFSLQVSLNSSPCPFRRNIEFNYLDLRQSVCSIYYGYLFIYLSREYQGTMMLFAPVKSFSNYMKQSVHRCEGKWSNKRKQQAIWQTLSQQNLPELDLILGSKRSYDCRHGF